MREYFLVDVFDLYQICEGEIPVELGQEDQTRTEHIVAVDAASSEHAEGVHDLVQEVELPFKACVGYFV